MKKLFQNCIYQGKNTYRDFGFLFWTLIYPILLAVFFNIAFSGLLNIEMEDISVGVDAENPILPILEEVDILNVEKISNTEAEKKLNDEEIHAYIDKNLNILVKKSGIEQTIVREIVEQIRQIGKLNRPIERYDFTKNYVSGKNQRGDSIIIAFYSLFAMVSTYGLFVGIESITAIQANLSKIGTRINMTPLKKENFLLSGAIVSLLLNLFANCLLFMFIEFVLKIHIFTDLKYSALLIVMGNLFGVALGIFIGASNRRDANIKRIIGIIVTLSLSFLSGMMGSWIKVMLDRYVPIVARINPIAIITNSLYRINLLESTKNVGEGIFLLGLYSIILLSISYVFLRRQSYDSI